MHMSVDVETERGIETLDITSQVEDAIPSNVSTGLCHVFVPHTTAGVFVNEAESGLLEDVEGLLGDLVPEGDGYAHDAIDDNADAHLRSILLGSSVSVPILDGQLELGTWQRVLFFEGDGPRSRSVRITTLES